MFEKIAINYEIKLFVAAICVLIIIISLFIVSKDMDNVFKARDGKEQESENLKILIWTSFGLSILTPLFYKFYPDLY